MFWGNKFVPEPLYKKWNNQPGGTVVDRYTDTDGTKFVVVEFSHSPGSRYLFLA